MSIPFIRAYPNGQYKAQPIERPTGIELLAFRFIAQGGRYFIAILSADEVHMAAATFGADGELYELVHDTVPNNPELLPAIDRLVRKSVEHLGAMH